MFQALEDTIKTVKLESENAHREANGANYKASKCWTLLSGSFWVMQALTVGLLIGNIVLLGHIAFFAYSANKKIEAAEERIEKLSQTAEKFEKLAQPWEK